MIYFWQTADGDFTMITDREDREAAAEADLIGNWEPGSNLGMMLDTAQMCARQAGLFQWTDEPVPGKEHWNCKKVIFPHGPFCVPRPLMAADMASDVQRTRRKWQRARVIERPEGFDCTPLPRARRIAR
jgi:hypothetical protein